MDFAVNSLLHAGFGHADEPSFPQPHKLLTGNFELCYRAGSRSARLSPCRWRSAIGRSPIVSNGRQVETTEHGEHEADKWCE
jgi:hypothetical protein